jgi:hypothetical protein
MQFLKTHERLIIVVLCLIGLVWCVNKYLDHASDKADAKAETAQQVVQQQIQVNAQLADQVKQTAAQYQSITDELMTENQQLLTAIASRNQTVSAQQQKDQSLPLPDLALRWENLASLKAADITATTSGLQVSEAGSRTTVQNLEQLPVLQSNLADMQKIADNYKEQTSSCQRVNSALTSQVDGLNKQISGMDASCKAEVAAVKAKARKEKLKAFGWGTLFSGLVWVAKELL